MNLGGFPSGQYGADRNVRQELVQSIIDRDIAHVAGVVFDIGFEEASVASPDASAFIEQEFFLADYCAGQSILITMEAKDNGFAFTT